MGWMQTAQYYQQQCFALASYAQGQGGAPPVEQGAEEQGYYDEESDEEGSDEEMPSKRRRGGSTGSSAHGAPKSRPKARKSWEPDTDPFAKQRAEQAALARSQRATSRKSLEPAPMVKREQKPKVKQERPMAQYVQSVQLRPMGTFPARVPPVEWRG
jgi:hypothetical protein